MFRGFFSRRWRVKSWGACALRSATCHIQYGFCSYWWLPRVTQKTNPTGVNAPELGHLKECKKVALQCLVYLFSVIVRVRVVFRSWWLWWWQWWCWWWCWCYCQWWLVVVCLCQLCFVCVHEQSVWWILGELRMSFRPVSVTVHAGNMWELKKTK